jgi:hypothetical protein
MYLVAMDPGLMAVRGSGSCHPCASLSGLGPWVPQIFQRNLQTGYSLPAADGKLPPMVSEHALRSAL